MKTHSILSTLVLAIWLLVIPGTTVVDCQDIYMATIRNELCRKHIGDMQQVRNKTWYLKPDVVVTDRITEASLASVIYLNRSFEDVMKDFQKIFSQKGATKQQASCFKTNFVDVGGVYSRYFNSKFIDTVTKIIKEARGDKIQYRKNASDIANFWSSWGSAKLPTLVQFALQNDYSRNFYRYHTDAAFACEVPTSAADDLYFSCAYEILVKGQSVNVLPKGSVLTELAKCSVMPALNCSLEYTRYWSLYDWSILFPKLPVGSTGAKMVKYFDETIRNGAAKKITLLKYDFKRVYATWSANSLYVSAANVTQEDVVFGTCNFTDVIINTKKILVIGTWLPTSVNGSCALTKLSITSYVTRVVKKKTLTGTFLNTYDLKNIVAKKINNKPVGGKLSDKKTKINYLFQSVSTLNNSNIRLIIYDVISNAYFEFDANRISAYIQRQDLTGSIGALVNGFADIDDVVGRRRRDVDLAKSCEEICRDEKYRLALSLNEGEVSDYNGIGEYALRHATSVSDCIDKCFDEA